jgi:MFS superfamily sulfate permease-like transporter
MKSRKLLTVIAVLALCLAAIPTIGAVVEEPPDTVCGALEMLGTAPIINLAVGAFVAALLEYWPKWSEVAPKWKRPIVFVFCLVVPVVGLIGRVAFCGAVINPDEIYRALSAGALAFASSQFAHIYKLPSK